MREIERQPRLSIGLPCENPKIETRLALTPEGVSIVVEEGHIVLVERGAGLPMSYTDLQYSEAGALSLTSKAEVFGADIVLKSHLHLRRTCADEKRKIYFSMLQLSYLSAESIRLMMSKN